MNSLHINYWNHLNVALTSAHINTLPRPTHFFQEEACQASIHIQFYTISDDVKCLGEEEEEEKYVGK
jgi:hypothetical protein